MAQPGQNSTSQMAQLSQCNVVISRTNVDEIPTMIAFTKMARKAMFPMLTADSHDQLADRELNGGFQRAYMDSQDGAFLGARIDGTLVATIGFVAYDNRFPYLQLGGGRVVEVVRLYVDPDHRRAGIASQLLIALKSEAQRAGIDQLYLHTHPFLPGAIDFWERHGFSILHVDDDPVWHTTHMSLSLSNHD
jgi:GNAT superfamily N-acetyltransferase